jgi:subtilisin family serine protease
MLRLGTALTLLVLLALAAKPPAEERAPQPPAAVAGEAIVRLRPGALALTDVALGRRLDAEVIERLPELQSLHLRLRRGEAVSRAVTRLRRLPLVSHAEPNHVLRAAMIPTDPLFTAQSAYLNLIEAPAAWDLELGQETVLVAVLDTGIDIEHPDLKGKVWSNAREALPNGIDDDNNGCIDDQNGCSFVSQSAAAPACGPTGQTLIKDDHGHGTFVAGIIAARGNNGQGSIGVAPGVTILPVKILDCEGGGTAADAARALLYAAGVGARVANISFGADGESQTLANAIREAHNRFGMVIVAATGNSGRRGVTFPARLPETLAVASSGTALDDRARSPFSDWGVEVKVAAPGLNVVSTVPSEHCDVWVCLPGQPYAVSSGTSFAAPIVSGLAALLISHNPNLSAGAVQSLILATADPLADGDTPNWDGAGRIRMSLALRQPRYYLGIPGVSKP